MISNKKIILASKSPRRQELLKLMQIDFDIQLKEVDESYPKHLTPRQVVSFIAENKANAFEVPEDQIILTADTLVSVDNEILGKPKDREEAKQMLKKLSGSEHWVYTGVCLKFSDKVISFVEETKVFCREVSELEVDFYIDNFKPYDKAGSYGIQDWWGINVVSRIEGSYTNVMGLPTEALYRNFSQLNTKLI